MWGVWLAVASAPLACSSGNPTVVVTEAQATRDASVDADPRVAEHARDAATVALASATAVPADPTIDASAEADAASALLPVTGTLPAIGDPWQPGPFTPVTDTGVGPDGDGSLYHPDLQQAADVRFPIVIFDGLPNIVDADLYRPSVEHLASHGFAVYLARATEGGAEILAAIDWMVAENANTDSPLYQRLDPERIAAGGHSIGSHAVIAVGDDPRLRTTFHAAGEPSQPYEAITTLHAPAAFFCVDINILSSEPAPNSVCSPGFDQLEAPALRAVLTGWPPDSVEGNALGVFAGWLRWQLADDMTMKAMFLGDDCALCTRPQWSVEQHGLE